MKSLYFLRSHIADNMISILVIMLQIVVTIVVFNMFWIDCEELIITDSMYNSLDLDNVACISLEDADEDDDILSRLDEDDGITVIGENYGIVNFTVASNDYITFQLVSPEYVKYFGDTLSRGSWTSSETPSDAYAVVIPSTMALEYRLGNTYILTDIYSDVEMTVYISGILSSNYTFIQPSGTSSGDIVERLIDTMLICCDDNEVDNVFGDSIFLSTDFVHSGYYTIFAQDRAKLESAEENFGLDVYGYMDARSAKQEADSLVRLEMGTPLALTIIVLILCIANYSSYSMLSAIKREKEFAVYFICGSTWKRCLRLQLMEDLIIVVVPFAVSIIVCALLSLNREYALMSAWGLLLSVCVCAVVMMLSTIVAFLRIKKKSPVEMMRRWL